MRIIADDSKILEAVDQLASQIVTQVIGASDGNDDWALVGIRSRGDVLSLRLFERIDKAKQPSQLGVLDITLYRDDLSEIAHQPIVRPTEIDFSIDGLNVVLVDDVLMTGRSIRAALQCLMDLGRPRRIWLAVLVDRGGRELPIQPDFVGFDLSKETLDSQTLVNVHLMPFDSSDQVIVEAIGQRESA